MVTATSSRLVTAHDLLRLSSGGFYGELIRGELCERMPPGFHHEKIVAKLIALLLVFAESRNIGTVIGGAGVWTERNPDTVRAPDVQFFSAERLPLDADIPGYAETSPDLAIEVRSPNDRPRDVHDKAIMWLNAGVELVWVVLPEHRCVDVYRRRHEVVTVTDADSLDGLDVIPGFSCALEDFLGPAPQEDAPVAH